MGVVTLQVLERAHKEVMALSRTEKGAFYDFLHKFRQNPDSPGLRRKQLKGDSRLWSARITDDYRALLLHIENDDFLVVAVKHRREVYDNLDRYEYRINRVTGGIEVVDLGVVGDSAIGRLLPPPPDDRKEEAPTSPPGLFAQYTDEQLLELGAAEPLLPSIARVTTEDELLALVEVAPQLTAEVLLALYEGRSFDEVMEQVTAPVRSPEPVDTEDFAAALARPATPVTSDDAALQAVIEQPFERWQVFLHPTQRTLVERHFNGPAKVSGGPGTGKTIVALHRARHLALHLPSDEDRKVLLTTFNRNLAADLRARLLSLAGADVADRIDVINVDRIASQVITEAGIGRGRRVIPDSDVAREWEALLLEAGENRFSADFLADEWSQVILGQAVQDRAGYFQARRVGRGRALTREDRDRIWTLVERFEQRLAERNVWTWRQIAATAARLEMARTGRRRYAHVVVDEAQDLAAAHWKLLRAFVEEGPNDIFLVGDPHQRIYDNYVTLSSLGINVRGRSSRLTLSYRTTRQILGTALNLLDGTTYDDLDGGSDTLAGYRSLLRGEPPILRGAATWADEQELIVGQVKEWVGAGATVAVCVPTRDMVTAIVERLGAAGIDTSEIGPDGPKRADSVHVGTMHRFKGLEYQNMAIGGVCDGVVPRADIERLRNDIRRYERERQRERSLLFVAATRARDGLAITWHGRPSPFLPVSVTP